VTLASSSADHKSINGSLLYLCNGCDLSLGGADVVFGSQQDLQPPHPCRCPVYKVVVVQVLENNHLKINDNTATWDNLGRQLNNIFKLRAEKVAFVKGDDAVVFAVVARAIDVMRSSGVEKVG
jgi:hypothetical protein